MPDLRLSEGERLDVLAVAVLDYLDDTFTEGELEAGGAPTDLYNLASAASERRTMQGGYDHVDRLSSAALAYSAGSGRLGAARKELLEKVGADA